MSSPTKLRQMAKELGWPPELEKAADQLQKLKRENAALRGRCEELEAERTQFANRAARLAAFKHELEESRKAERLARAQLQSEREARK